MDVQIKLSICIATLNRAAYIEKTLDSIVSQITEKIEIVIVDGASTDNTEEIVRNYKERFPNVNYIRLAEKGGADKDFSLAVELAQGEYCWLFADDDLIKPGAINSVLNVLEKNPGLLIVNAEVRNYELIEILKPRCLEITKNKTYSEYDSEELFREIANYLSFIGCVVIRRSLWKARDNKRYYGSLFVHVGVIFQAQITGGTIVLADPMIIIRYGNALWTDMGFEVSLFKWPNLIWSFPSFTDSSKMQVCVRHPWLSIARLSLFRARGLYTSMEYNRFIKNRIHYPANRLLSYYISLFPGSFLNLVWYLYFLSFGSRHPNAQLTLKDLENSKFNWKNIFNLIK
jgi:abequosyltransferase